MTSRFLTAPDVARIVHAANSALRAAIWEPVVPLEEYVSNGRFAGVVQGVLDQLVDPVDDGEASHERWLKSMDAQGVTDHPCQVPYDQLPPAQQAKDELFRAIVEYLEPYTKY